MENGNIARDYHVHRYINIFENVRRMRAHLPSGVIAFHSAPNRFEISELCNLGNSFCSCLRRDLPQTIKAFIGRLM